MVQIYNSSLYSILTVPQYHRAIDTVQDLLESIEHDTHHLLTHTNLGLVQTFLRSKPEENPVFYSIGRHLNRTRRQMFDTERFLISTVEANPRNVVFSSRSIMEIKRFQEAKIRLHIGSENIVPTYTSLGLEKRSALKESLDKV